MSLYIVYIILYTVCRVKFDRYIDTMSDFILKNNNVVTCVLLHYLCSVSRGSVVTHYSIKTLLSQYFAINPVVIPILFKTSFYIFYLPGDKPIYQCRFSANNSLMAGHWPRSILTWGYFVRKLKHYNIAIVFQIGFWKLQDSFRKLSEI